MRRALPPRRLRPAVGVLALLVLLLGACSVRLDLPPGQVPVPEGDDAVRQEASLKVTAVGAGARAVIASAPQDSMTERWDRIAQDAEQHLQTLGGVWVPPARPEHPDPTVPALDVPGTPEGTVEHLEQTAAWLAEQAVRAEPELATVAASIATNYALHAAALRSDLGMAALPDPEPGEDPYPEQLGEEAGELCRLLDAAGYVAEIRAARGDGDERARQAAQLRSAADLLATRAELAGTDADPRQAAYRLDLADLEAQAQDLRRALVPAWLALLGPAEGADRERILIQVQLSAASAYGTQPPALPGLSDAG